MSKLPKLEAVQKVRSTDTDIVLTLQTEAKKPVTQALTKSYAELANSLSKKETWNASFGAIQFVRFGGKSPAENVLFAGLGLPGAITEDKLRILGGHLHGKLKAEKVFAVTIDADGLFEILEKAKFKDPARGVRVFAEGLVLNCYEWGKYRAKSPEQIKTEQTQFTLHFLTSKKERASILNSHFEEVLAHLEAANLCRDWSNEPSNHGTPEYFAQTAKKLAQKYKIKCRILSESDAKREGMGLFLAVGQGSTREGKIVVLEYSPKQQGKARRPRTIALVGKGITFDSGGISIKPSLGMEEMKHDMTGAATLFAATLLAAKWEVPHRVVTVLAFTENMPDGSAIQPGNVIKGRSGKTVEINNTDAEGRLILADVLDYAQDFKPDVVLDAATLTGAIGIALGKYCAGVFTNSEETWLKLKKAGDEHGDRLWQMPCFDEYFEDLKSETADMRNVANDGRGGASRGAVFLKQFIRKGVNWIHMDIASTANGVTHIAHLPKRGATGQHVGTVATFIRDFV